MASPMSLAMRALEKGRCGEAAERFADLVGSWPGGTNVGDAVIARFRRAETLSRLGRHDEAVADAAAAHRDSPTNPATALWLAWVFGEAGRFDEAAAVAYPKGHEEFIDTVRDGFIALARLAAGSRDDRRGAAKQLLASRHAPILSLALRLAEANRLCAGPRWPDPLSVWSVHVAMTDGAESGVATVPATPAISDPRLPSRSEVGAAAAWLRNYGACAYEPRLVTVLRNAKSPPSDTDSLEAEMLLSTGHIDEAAALVTRIRSEIKADDADAELCVTACRIEQIRGRAARPSEFPGYADAKSRAKPDVSWLEMCAALLDGRPLDARVHADSLADPSHAEYVEASLLGWAGRNAR